MMKHNGLYKFIQYLIYLTLCSVLISCVPQSTNSSRSKSTTEGTTTTDDTPSAPTYSSELNFLQASGVSSTTAFETTLNFDDKIYLRGSEVDTYIRDGNETTTQCMSFVFAETAIQKVLVVQAQPRSFFNYGTNKKEYYFLINPNAETENTANCLTSGLVSQMATTYPSYTVTYDFVNTCGTCNETLLTSSDTNIYTTAGNKVSDINVSPLYLRVYNTLTGTTPGAGTQTCTETSECTALGYDCCVGNQCINDQTVKSGVDTSSTSYLQAVADIAIDSSRIYNYPEFYNLCSSSVTPTPTPPVTIDPDDVAAAHFELVKELYECTNPVEGEMSYCTVTYTDADPGTYLTTGDDRNFSTTHTSATSQYSLTDYSIVEVIHAGETIFDGTSIDTTKLTIAAGNDDMFNQNSINLIHTQSSSADNNDLKIKFKIDGSCEKVNTTLAKCYKEYVQGEGQTVTGGYAKVTDHYPGSDDFELPLYADTSKTIKVEVDSSQKLEGTHWNLVAGSPSKIQFIGSGVNVYDDQTVKITFFVDTATYNVLQSKQTAIETIATMCKCPDESCRLEPLETMVNGVATITDYICKYEDNTVTPPLQQTVYLDAKTVPVRYYDINGANHDEVTVDLDEQELTEFSYTSNNVLRPNNVDSYIGFNEIYGSISNNAGSAVSAKVVDIELSKTYDIYVTAGNFSSCENCGTDYYSNMARLFPKNFLYGGAGYLPHASLSDKSATQEFRGDDLIFGRACFLPATMIPWAHASNTTRIDQRRNRLTTQHFLFANGYQRDWFGFDYGSVIGSFDGVSWFSIGTNRRIQATSTKLFLAVNAYFGDQTIDTNFTVMVSDSTSSSYGGGPTTDYASDGAQCQAYHECDTDNECASRLGWDYVCAQVTSLQSPYPDFDSNGLELTDSSILKRILTMNGPSAGSAKRCVYRGKGAPCVPTMAVSDSSISYNKVTDTKLLGCSSNNYCQAFVSGSNVTRFNDRIARFAKSVKAQNASSYVTESDLDTFGLAARFLGRPYSWIGSEEAPQTAINNLSTNFIDGICVPGRNPADTTPTAQNTATPSTDDLGDQVNGQGMTMSGNTASTAYLSSCANFDDSGEYVHLNPDYMSTSLSNSDIYFFAGGQSLSTNNLGIFETLNSSDLIKSFENEFIESKTLAQNRCLRAPGASCHTNMDCSPSKYITDKINSMDPDDHGLGWGSTGSGLNSYEIKFWQETLICSQETATTDPDYDVKDNRCCREVGNTITIPTEIIRATTPDFQNDVSDGKTAISTEKVPGIDIDLDDPTRYSRVSTIYYDLKKTGSTLKAMKASDTDNCGTACETKSDLEKQYETLNLYVQRTCCSKNWVRNFDENNGSGGHEWGPTKMQNVDKTNFACLNWSPPAINPGVGSFTCANVDDPLDAECNMRSTPATEAANIFNWFATMELTGIPQIAINSVDSTDIRCKVDPSDSNLSGSTMSIPGFISDTATAEYSSGGDEYLSAIDSTNFDSATKTVFSEDEFSCCLPLDTQMQAGDNANLCCSGYINPSNNKCALRNYTNLSVYFNKYVSSEANGISDSLIDSETGFINSSAVVQTLACQLNACASGVIATGIALTDLKYKGHETNAALITRFIDGNDTSNNYNGVADLFDDGLRWNTHVYCVPQEAASNADALNIISCAGN
jgi:hypothetical protein